MLDFKAIHAKAVTKMESIDEQKLRIKRKHEENQSTINEKVKKLKDETYKLDAPQDKISFNFVSKLQTNVTEQVNTILRRKVFDTKKTIRNVNQTTKPVGK